MYNRALRSYDVYISGFRILISFSIFCMAIKISTKHLWCLTHSIHSVYLLNVWIYEWLNDGYLNTNSDHCNWWESLIKKTTISLKCVYVCVACMYVNGLQCSDSFPGDIHFLNNSCLTLQFSSVAQSCLTLCNPMDYIASRLLSPRDSPGKNTGVGCPALL